MEHFLNWVDESVMISRHVIHTQRKTVGKAGSVTGFCGAVAFSLTREANEIPEYVQLYHALHQLAAYCGTGHKTTFGLGQTLVGWQEVEVMPPSIEDLIANRVDELVPVFMAQSVRQGGNRAKNIATVYASIIARKELGATLHELSEVLDIPYETVKTYSKQALRKLRDVA